MASAGEQQIPALVARDLSFTYPGRERETIHGIDIEVSAGEHVGIIGPSESGKTTLCLCLAGVIPHVVQGKMTGEVLVSGSSTLGQSIPDLSKRVGIIFDDPEVQLFNVTVEDEVAFGPQNLGLDRAGIMERVDEALEWTGTASLRDAPISTLSGGQKQRVAIASVLAMRPPILILDEPTSMLDPAGARQVFEVLDRLRSREGMTIVTVERNVERLAEFADRLFILAGGSVVSSGAPRDVLSRVEGLLGMGLEPPQVTLLEYEARRHRGGELPGSYSISLQEARDWFSSMSRERRQQGAS